MKKIVLILLLLSFNLNSQTEADVSIELHDGNFIKGKSKFNTIELSTDYGKLTIPISKVYTIKIGYGKDKTASDKAFSLLKILINSGNEDVKKGAYNDLLKIGPKAIPAFDQFYSDSKNFQETDYQGIYTIDNALEEIKSINNMDENMIAEDILTIDNMYTMGGVYEFGKLDVKTEYGSLTIPKEKIKSIDVFVISGNSNGEVLIKLMGNKHISGNKNGGWYKTGIMLKAGQKFSAVASGAVTLASLSNAIYTPDGSTKGTSNPDYEDDGGLNNTYPTYGNVVYKIGENSYENLKIGSKFNGAAKTSGMLYLSIYETVYNANNKGSYTIKLILNK